MKIVHRKMFRQNSNNKIQKKIVKFYKKKNMKVKQEGFLSLISFFFKVAMFHCRLVFRPKTFPGKHVNWNPPPAL